MNEVPGNFIYRAMAIGCCTMCCIKTWKEVGSDFTIWFFTMLSLLKLSQLLLGTVNALIFGQD